MVDTLLMAALALTIEAGFGYPDTVFRAIRHPVVWMGALIGVLDARLNRPGISAEHRRRRGVAALVTLMIVVAVPSAIVQSWVLHHLWRPGALAVLAVLASTLLASNSLATHVLAVARGIDRGLAEGRVAVSAIVGRDPSSLDEAGVARAAIESLAENCSDGVVAPALWCGLLGLPGIALYKAINTADSMIGHRTARHSAFGWAAARLDDVVNLPASRLTAGWIVLAAALQPGASGREAIRIVRRDARHHRSPNAGWPEAAMAGALGLRLAGPRVYGDVRVEDAWLGDGRAAATAEDIVRALRLYRLAMGLQIGAFWVLAALIARG